MATELPIDNLNLSQESDPDVFFNTVPEKGQSVIKKTPQENLPSDLNLSQESDNDIFFATEHNSGFLHSSGSLDSTLPIPDQERIAWQARQDLPPAESLCLYGGDLQLIFKVAWDRSTV